MTLTELEAWFAGSIPSDWFSEPVSIEYDRDEILVTGTLPLPEFDGDANVAASGRIASFREDTRAQRIDIAERAQENYQRRVSWAVACGDVEVAYTTASVPVMTRLAMEERAVLDALIDAGVARSRSDAVGWCVHLVAENEGEWIADLQQAMGEVTKLRNSGPASRRDG